MSQRPWAPEAPQILAGDVVPGDTAFMLRCMLEELMLSGLSAAQLRALACDASYQALYAGRATLGDAAFDGLLNDVSARVGRLSCRVCESPPEQAAALTVHGRIVPAGNPT